MFNVKILFFLIWWVFSWMIPYEKINKLTPFEDNMSQNDLLSSHITVSGILLCPALFSVSNTLLCPAHNCVQQNTVSTLTQKFICSLSLVNVLRLYHAALVKHMSFVWCNNRDYGNWNLKCNVKYPSSIYNLESLVQFSLGWYLALSSVVLYFSISA